MRVPPDPGAGWIDPETGDRVPVAKILAMADESVADLAASVSPRNYIGISAGNAPATLLKTLGCLRADLVPAPLPLDMRPDDKAACYRRLGVAAVMTDDGWRHGDDPPVPAPDGVDLVMHSSGSTGMPKPLAIFLESMRRNACDVGTLLGIGADDVHLGSMSHCYMSGLFNATLLPFYTGGTCIPGPLVTATSLGALVELIGRYRPTVLWVNPLVAKSMSMLRSIRPQDLDGLRMVISCTAPLDGAVQKAFETKFALPLLNSYGLCETLIATVETPEDRRAPDAVPSVGRPVAGPGSIVVSPSGRLLVRNGAIYGGPVDVGDADGARQSMAPLDAFESQDLGAIDAAGRVSVTGRADIVINRNGLKMSPEAIESRIQSLTTVVDCAVGVGGSDGARMVALIVSRRPSPSIAADLFASFSDVLGPEQRPNDVLAVDAIPRTPSGKIDRPAVAAIIAASDAERLQKCH